MSNANWSATKNLNVLADGVQIDDGLCESVGQTNAIQHIMEALAPGAAPTFLDLSLVDEAAAPTLTFDHFAATPASGTEVGRIGFRGEDDGGNAQAYAQIRGYVDDDTNGAETGYLTVHVSVAGTPTERLRVSDTGVGVGTSPSYLFHVKEDGATTAIAAIESGDAVTTRNVDLRLMNLGQEWRLRNDTNKDFVINDATNSRTPFLIRDNAPTSSVIVEADGVADFGVGINLVGGSDLKDYKEGTWTPALSFGGGSTGITYGSRTGTYVQIGLWIYFTIQMTLTNKGSSTGTAAITLPTSLSGSRSIVTDNGIAHWAKYSNMSGISSPNGRPVSSSSLQLQSKGSAAIGTVSNTNFTNTSSLTLVGHARLA